MARRNKLWRFAQLQQYANYYEASTDAPAGSKRALNAAPDGPASHTVVGASGEALDLRGKWAAAHFGNDNPITLELACGRGEYTLALARSHPDRNFIGVDIKGARIYLGATEARDEGLGNAAFLRTRIERIDEFFAVGEVAEIWITFPDPFLKSGSVNRRLTSPRFWASYARMLPPGGCVHLKTDDPTLYEYSQEISDDLQEFTLEADVADVYGSDKLPHPELGHKTYYEAKNISGSDSIKYLRWRRGDEPAPPPFDYDELARAPVDS